MVSFQLGNILIVDDQPANIKVLFELLQHSGYRVSVAKSGLSALSKVKQVQPDLILLDVMMPDMDGFETCHHLKTDIETRAIPVIFLSALDGVIDKVKAFNIGGVDYITKPFHIEEVLVRVKNQLTLRAAEVEMRKAFEKEKELNELKSSFISTTSHEFRTPLTTILSSAELLEHYSHKWSEEKKLDHIRRIQASVNRMKNLLDDVLLIGKAEAGKLEFQPKLLDIAEFCRELVAEIQLHTEIHTIAFCYQGQYTKACMDEKLLQHVLINLLSNAIKYSPQGGIIDFQLFCEQEKVIFRIQDWGIGIPLEDQDKLFNSFQRASNVGMISGTGLGLAIVKKSVDTHGGQIYVQSEVNEGTTFVVMLPLNQC